MANRVFFTIALRIGLISAGALLLLTTIWGTITYGFKTTLPYTLIGSLVAFLSVYITAKILLGRRLALVAAELENLLNKRFFDHEIEKIGQRDELDDILRKLNETTDTVEGEIQRLKRMENYRKEFIGDVSHELKTPIFAIQGFIETLLNGALEDPEVNREFLQKAMRNVNRLIQLTNDLMEISKLETGELKTSLVHVPLKAVMLEVVENLQYKANLDQVNIEVLPIDSSLMVLADRNQLRQVLVNLVENAIKYNRTGGKVTISVKPTPHNPKKVTVMVQDTGIGIDPKHLSRVTERFYRIDKSRSREKGGTGLGLAIVKHIIEAHNEQLFIDSTPNVGTTFSFTLQNARTISG